MSERVTWEACVRCGRRAAVGWVPVRRTGGAPTGNRPVEFDCIGGCQVGREELARAYARPARRRRAESAGEPGPRSS